MTPDGIGQRFQQSSGFTDPIRQGGAIQIEAFTVKDLALTVQRKMIGIFADQHMGQETRPGAAAFDGPRRERGLHEAFAARAGQPGPDDAVHDKPTGDVFQFLGHILTDPTQAPAAIGTGICARRQFDLHPGDVVRDRAALWLVPLLDVRQLHPRRHGRGGNLAGLERELKLLGRLGRGPEPVRPVPSQLMAQLLDQYRLRLDLGQQPRGEAAQLLGVFRQGQGLIEHARSLSHCIPRGNPSLAGQPDYPAAKGCHVRCGARQSIPSSSIDNCAGDSATLPSLAEGQTNRPFSSRFRNMQAPWPSHQMTLTRSPRRPRKTNRCPVKGSCFSTASACAAKAAKPLRMSVTPAASQTRVVAGTGIKPTVPGSGGPEIPGRSCR